MFGRLSRRITYVNVAMTLALVFAMSGGAYAAKHYLITSTKQISPKVIAALKGKAGTQGPSGPAGPQGPVGAAGKDGTNGTNGKEGESVTTKSEPKGTHCKEGGESFTVAGKTEYACNGEKGEPWTAGGTLPKGASEKGEWSVIGTGGAVGSAISFNIPLAAALNETHTHFIGEKEGEGESKPAAAITSHECEGTYKAPKAASGQLCVFVAITSPFLSGLIAPVSKLEGGAGADPMGAQLLFSSEKSTELFFAQGSWAVTG